MGETERLYGILDKQLESRDYLVGPGKGQYSIADIASYSWCNVSYFAGVDISQFRNLHAWWKRINDRPAVQRGLAVPSESKIINQAYVERLKSEEGFKEKEDGLAKLRDQAKEQYGYKYSSP